MSNDEQAALDFFSQPEHLPLALIAADHLDGIRLRLNNDFWTDLSKRVDSLLAQHTLAWGSSLTEDRNNASCLVGMYLQPQPGQNFFIRPFMEQQFMGDAYRIYYGLMWSSTPSPSQKSLPAVESLRKSLQISGFKESDSFLAWQWLPWHPRQKEFLLRFATKRESFMDEAVAIWSNLVLRLKDELLIANHALNSPSQAVAVSLEQMRNKLKTS